MLVRLGPGGMSQMFRLLFLGNGWADCVEIWHAVGDPLVTAYAVITGGVSLHVRTRRDTPTPRFCISETARPIAFKFGTVDLDNFVPLFNFSLCSMSSIYPKR